MVLYGIMVMSNDRRWEIGHDREREFQYEYMFIFPQAGWVTTVTVFLPRCLSVLGRSPSMGCVGYLHKVGTLPTYLNLR